MVRTSIFEVEVPNCRWLLLSYVLIVVHLWRVQLGLVHLGYHLADVQIFHDMRYAASSWGSCCLGLYTTPYHRG
jgi:hypothetical protein